MVPVVAGGVTALRGFVHAVCGNPAVLLYVDKVHSRVVDMEMDMDVC